MNYMNAQLQTFKNAFLVNNNINKVWEFYTDIDHLKITPKEINLKVINARPKIQSGNRNLDQRKNIDLKRRSWHSIITFL
jgi:hypothetical protein